jgi:hypothetical protein
MKQILVRNTGANVIYGRNAGIIVMFVYSVRINIMIVNV